MGKILRLIFDKKIKKKLQIEKCFMRESLILSYVTFFAFS